MAYRVPERLHRLPGKNTPRSIGNSTGDHHGQAHTSRFKHRLHSKNSRLGVQRIEDGLDKYDVDATIQQPVQLLGVCLAQLFERDIARCRVVDIRRNGGGFRLRPQSTCNETGALWCAEFIACLARQLGRRHVHLISKLRQTVITLRNRCCTKCIGFDNIGTGRQILAMNFRHQIRANQTQKLVISLQVFPMRRKTFPPEIRLGQLIALNHGAHGAVKHQNAIRQ